MKYVGLVFYRMTQATSIWIKVAVSEFAKFPSLIQLLIKW